MEENSNNNMTLVEKNTEEFGICRKSSANPAIVEKSQRKVTLLYVRHCQWSDEIEICFFFAQINLIIMVLSYIQGKNDFPL